MCVWCVISLLRNIEAILVKYAYLRICLLLRFSTKLILDLEKCDFKEILHHSWLNLPKSKFITSDIVKRIVFETLILQRSIKNLLLFITLNKPITKLENSSGTLKSTYKVCCRVVPLSELIMLSIHNVLGLWFTDIPIFRNKSNLVIWNCR